MEQDRIEAEKKCAMEAEQERLRKIEEAKLAKEEAQRLAIEQTEYVSFLLQIDEWMLRLKEQIYIN